MNPSPSDLATRNAAFQSLTPAGKRRAIARDVIARLDTQRITPHRGEWIKVYGTDLPQCIQTLFDSADAPPCQACALGAAVIGMAHFENQLDLQSYVGISRLAMDDSGANDRLIALFGIPQLILIERCFETSPVFHMYTPLARAQKAATGYVSSVGGEITDDIIEAAAPFRETVFDKDDALRLIWSYIAQDTEGRFDAAKALDMRDVLLARPPAPADREAKG